MDIPRTTESGKCVRLLSINSIDSNRSNYGKQRTVIVTGGSQGIGAAVVKHFWNAAITWSAPLACDKAGGAEGSPNKLALVDGDIGQAATAKKAVDTAIQKFGSIDAVVNNAGIFSAKPFTDYSAADFRALVSTNLEGYIYITQFAVKQMLAQKSGGSVVGITSSLVENPIGGLPVSLPMITKGGLEAITRSLASEYSKEHIRFNAVAPGVVDTPLHKDNPKDFLKTFRRWARSPHRKTSQALWSISLNRARSPGRCCTWTAVRTTANGKPGRFAAGRAEQRLKELGVELPTLPTRLAHTSRRCSQGACCSSVGCCRSRNGKLQSVGRLGKELDESAGRDALRTATLNALSAAKAHVGSLDRVTRVVSVKVYLATYGDFYNQPIVADAASELLRDVFGEDKMSVRSVLGVASFASGRAGHARDNVRSRELKTAAGEFPKEEGKLREGCPSPSAVLCLIEC